MPITRGTGILLGVGGCGRWLVRSLSPRETTRTLRAFQVALLGVDDGPRYTGHSLKATALSWAAKAGLAMPIRRLLGHHVKRAGASAVTYSRDAMAEPLRQLDGVLKSIADECFFPDWSQWEVRQSANDALCSCDAL